MLCYVRRLGVIVGGIILAAALALTAAADPLTRRAEKRCWQMGGDLVPPRRVTEIVVDWRALPPGYDCDYRIFGATVVKRPPSEGVPAGTFAKSERWRADDFVARGLPIPGTHPTLPFCSAEQMKPDTGRETLDPHADEPAEPTYCQAPPSGAIFERSPPRPSSR